jgi:glutamate racemase
LLYFKKPCGHGSDTQESVERLKIGVFDSGIGGITVLSEIHRQFPGQEFYYFGDTANVPYGTKSVTQIKNLCSYAATRIREYNLDLLIVACNTASSLALEEIGTELHPTPVVDVVAAGVATIKNHLTENSDVLVFGTKATINSHTYKNRLHAVLPNTRVIEQACPLLVPMIEEGWNEHKILRDTVFEYVKPFINKKTTALLACTHYPWIKNIFQEELKTSTVLDSAHAVVELLVEKYSAKLKAKGESKFHWHFSDPESVASFAFTTDFDFVPDIKTF